MIDPRFLAMVIRAITIIGIITAPVRSQAAPTAVADLILFNARVYTMEKSGWADAVAIKNGRIIAVGSNAAVSARAGTLTRVLDMHGKLVMPAFGDAHAHPIFGGMSHARCPLHAGKTISDYRQLITACVARTPGLGTVFGSGWNQALFPPNGIPNKTLLDAISTTRPLIFQSDGHTLWVNSKALELAKISRDTPDPQNGVIDRDPRGEPVGALEEAAMTLVEPLIPPPSAADLEGAIAYAVKLFNSMGITSWHDAAVDWDEGGTSKEMDAYKAVADRGTLTMHTVMDLRWKNDRGMEQIPDILKLSARAKQLGLTANGVKFFIDGVIPQRTAAMIEPYEGTTVIGTAQVSLDALGQAVSELDARDIQSHFHAIGDGGVREALDAVGIARQRNGLRDTRPMISHMTVIDPADQLRFSKLDVTAIFQPLWACDEPYMRLTMKQIGPARSAHIYPAQSILKGGGRIAYGADWSVASANPFEGIEVALTRVSPGSNAPPLNAGERVTLAQAIRAYTLDVAVVNRLDKETGSIAIGKSADLIVIDRNLFQIQNTEIHKARVLVTLFRGNPVFGSLVEAAR